MIRFLRRPISRRTGGASLACVALLGGCTQSNSNATSDTGALKTSRGSVESTAAAAAEQADVIERKPANDSFAPLNRAVGFGTLRLMDRQERPSVRDIVIYRSLPNELPRVAGVITTVAQTPLSHVNLRAVQDKVPNAYIEDAMDDNDLQSLIGKFVRFEVLADGYRIQQVTQAEVEAHFVALRPTEAQQPQRNLSVTKVRALSDVSFADWTAFGVKAANVATLRTFNLPDTYVPDGFAVPFHFYVEFMESTGLEGKVASLLDNELAEGADEERRSKVLADLREDIRSATMPKWMADELGSWQRKYPNDTPLRCRSSTNNEDLPNFSGAGLYDSFTQRPDEGHLSKCIKQVYASLWNDRAVIERDFYRIDHRKTAMGVLVHPNFDDERVNGVAVSADPLSQSNDAYYINSQLGEALVTNPDGTSIPEELLAYADAKPYVVAWSNKVKPATRVLNDDQATKLRTSLQIIHQRFAQLYDVQPGQQFAMEVEFKITNDGTLAIKQARNWVFSEPLQ
jgi:hypothetical protein